MGRLDPRYKAVVFDVTDLDNVACGVVDTKMVKKINESTGVEEERIGRAVETMHEWEAMQTGFELAQGKRDDSAAHRMADFPGIPLVNAAIRDMLWNETYFPSQSVSEAKSEDSEAESEEA